MIFFIAGLFFGSLIGIWVLHDYQKELGAGWFPWPFREIDKKGYNKLCPKM